MSGKFHIIDKSTWERSVYFDYYYTRIKCKYNLNANLDITHLVTEQKARGLRFFPVMLYVVMRAVNQNKEFSNKLLLIAALAVAFLSVL